MTEATQNLQKQIETSFSFRQNKQTGVKRETVTLKYAVLSAIGIIAALQSGDEKVVSLIEDTVAGLSTAQLRSYVDSDLEYNQDKANADADKLTLEYIANLPRAERNVVGKEDLEKFAEAYVQFMPEITGKAVEKVQTAAALFVERFKRAAGDNKVLTILQDQLALFAEKAPDQVVEDNVRALTYLSDKLKELLDIKITEDAL